MNFVIQLVEKKLKPDGIDIPVMKENKHEYNIIDLIYSEVAYGQLKCVTADGEFVKSFREIIPLNLVKQFLMLRNYNYYKCARWKKC